MDIITIPTDSGDLELVRASPDEVMPLALKWPMGMTFSREENQPYGLIFQIGEEEALGIKLQPPDTDERSATTQYLTNQALLASALPFYLEHQHPGIVLPCTYLKEKADGRFESGIAFFVAPGQVARSEELTDRQIRCDDRLGDGASRMVSDFLAAIVAGASQSKLPLNEVLIGIDVRPRLALGKLGMQFIVQGPKVFATQYPLCDTYPFWEFAVRAGYSKLPYVPMVTAAVPGSPNAPSGWLERVKHFAKS